MRLALMTFALLLAAGSAVYAADPGNPDAIVGTWLVQDKDGHVEIWKEADGTYSGKLTWIAHPTYDEPGDPEPGKPRHDRNNPDPAKRNQPILGLKILNGFKYTDKGVYKGGQVYDPENGKTYQCKMTLKSPNDLDVHGFIGVSLLGRSDHWTRITEEKK